MSITQDCKYAVRSLSRSPIFAFGAIATLALGIGVNSTIFTLANNALFRPMPAIARPARDDVPGAHPVALRDDDRERASTVGPADHQEPARLLVRYEGWPVPGHFEDLIRIDPVTVQLVLGTRRNPQFIDVRPCQGLDLRVSSSSTLLTL